MKLSNRLKTVADLVPKDCKLADIGADRGELSYELLERNQVSSVILSDISKNSLNRAKILFTRGSFGEITDFRVGSGFTVLSPNEVDCVVLAGMGGQTIVDIFQEVPEITASMQTIIVQAMGNSEGVRNYFMNHGFTITTEKMIFEDDHFYTIIKAIPGKMELTPEELFAGKQLMAEKNPILQQYIAKEITLREQILEDLKKREQGKERQEVLEKELDFLRKIEEGLQ